MEKLKWIEIYSNPEFYIDLEVGGHHIGIYFLLFIVFAEAGLFLGLFFSSDVFLFVAGIYSNKLINQIVPFDNQDVGLVILSLIVAISSVTGNLLAYWCGAKANQYFLAKKDGIFYKKKYLDRSRAFFNRYGVWAIILAHHIPIVRVFIPIFSAVSGMKFFRFLALIAISSIIWSFTITFLGHYLYSFLLEHYDVDLRAYMWLIIVIMMIGIALYTSIRFIIQKFSVINK